MPHFIEILAGVTTIPFGITGASQSAPEPAVPNKQAPVEG